MNKLYSFLSVVSKSFREMKVKADYYDWLMTQKVVLLENKKYTVSLMRDGQLHGMMPFPNTNLYTPVLTPGATIGFTLDD